MKKVNEFNYHDYNVEQFNLSHMESALAVWEWINEVTLIVEGHDWHITEWVDLRGNIGSIELRMQSVPIGIWVDEVIQGVFKLIGSDSYEDTFHEIDMLSWDFEVFPHILSNYLKDKAGKPVIYQQDFPNPEDIAMVLAAQIRMA